MRKPDTGFRLHGHQTMNRESNEPEIGMETDSESTRRTSILDYNGINSINNFISSYQRSQSFSALTLLEVGEIPTSSRFIEEDVFEEDRSNDINYQENDQLLNRHNSNVSSHLFITGSSTLPQTVFNSVNTLTGIALLSLPYGLRISGLIGGSIVLIFCYVVSNYSAVFLGDILKRKHSLVSYSDIGGYCGGNIMQTVITALFITDITGALISLSILFSDSFFLLFPSISKEFFKVFIYFLMFVLSFFPLNVLSIFSLLGVLSTFTMVITIIFCGLLTDKSPGSLLSPMPINLGPENNNWQNLLLAFGIFMAPWGGHPVYPELYRDMRHPHKFNKSTNLAFSITFSIDYTVAIIGFLMYGVNCQDSLIMNIMKNEDYPSFVKPMYLALMGILPISKMPLLAKPIITVYEKFFNINDLVNGKEGLSLRRLIYRVIFVLLSLSLALVFTSFGKVVAFLGSSICFTLCMTLPFYFKFIVFQNELSSGEKLLLKLGIFFGILLAISGTIGTIFVNP